MRVLYTGCYGMAKLNIRDVFEALKLIYREKPTIE